MLKPVSIVGLMLALLVGLLYLLVADGNLKQSDVLTVHCAAGLQRPLREVVQNYETERGMKVVMNVGGSGVLESQMKLAGGDLYIPADESYVRKAQEEGFIAESEPLVTLRAVIVVQEGNPRKIYSLHDLKRSGIRICMADSSAAIGSFVKRTLSDSGHWDTILPQVVVTKPTVISVLEDVANGSVDTAIVWDSVVTAYPHVEMIRVPLFERSARRAAVGVIKSGQVEKAREFMYYLVGNEASAEVLARLGYFPVSREGLSDE